MDATKAKAIEKITEKKTDWAERMSKNAEIGSINEEKEMVIERYEKVLSLLKGVEINEGDLVHIKKPLDELESYLKHIPNGPLFNDVFPTEIKERILSLSSPSDTDAFIAASVCEDWKMTLESRFEEQKTIFLCETDESVKPAELMKAAAAHKLDVHLVIGKPVIEVDSKLVTDALTSVSKFTITNWNYTFKYVQLLSDDWNYTFKYVQLLSDDQFEHLFASIEKGDKIMDEVKLIYLDLMGINQERLANCLVNKIKRLTLEADPFTPDDNGMLDGETFISKLLQDSANITLSHLTLRNIDLFQNGDEVSCTNVVNALCKVENVKLSGEFDFTSQMAKGLIKNILETPIVMKTLIIDNDDYVTNFREISNPQDLKNVFIKMTTLQLPRGQFSVEQLDAVRSLPDVEADHENDYFGVSFYVIKKGSSEIF